MSDENRAGGAAEVLWTAWTSGERIAALPDDVRPRDATEGFAAQLALGAHAGQTYGWKIAATTTAGQAHIGVSSPLPGPLFERFRHDPGDVLAGDDMHMRVVDLTFGYSKIPKTMARKTISSTGTGASNAIKHPAPRARVVPGAPMSPVKLLWRGDRYSSTPGSCGISAWPSPTRPWSAQPDRR